MCRKNFAVVAEKRHKEPAPAAAFAVRRTDTEAEVETRHMAVAEAAGILHRVLAAAALHWPTMALQASDAAASAEQQAPIPAVVRSRVRRAEARRKSQAARTAAGASEGPAFSQHRGPPWRSSL